MNEMIYTKFLLQDLAHSRHHFFNTCTPNTHTHHICTHKIVLHLTRLSLPSLKKEETILSLPSSWRNIIFPKAVQNNDPELITYAQVALEVKNQPASAWDVRDMGSIPGSGRSPGGGDGNPLQYSCLENPMERGDWWVPEHSVAQSQTQLKWLSTHALGKIYPFQFSLTFSLSIHYIRSRRPGKLMTK